MSADSSQKPAASLWIRLMGHQRSPWFTLGISLVLFLAPLAAAYLDGILNGLLDEGHWRLILSPAAVIVYILAVAPIVQRAEAGVLVALRPQVLIDDERFDRLVADASHLNPLGEIAAVGVGAIFGLWSGQSWLSDSDGLWLRLVLIPSAALMFALLAWTIYAAVAGTRLVAELHAQPLRVDILAPQPFWPIGRQSLIIALVFVGGIVLGMVFGLVEGGILDWRNWLMYALLGLVPVVVFFLNMRPTHRVLATEKKRELAAARKNITAACRTLMARIDAEEDTGSLGADVNALVAYEDRLRAASTWPYDMVTLRTLFFSVILPGVAALARLLVEVFFD